MAQNLKKNRSDNRGGLRENAGAKYKGNVQYQRRIKPEHVILMDTYLKSLKVLCVILLFYSCGHRTSAIEKRQIKTDSLNIENKRVLSQNITWANIGSIKPFDALKPMLIDGKEYFNVSIQFDKSISKGTKIEGSENLSYAGSESKEKYKQTEKTDYTILYLGMFTVLALLLFLYFYLKSLKLL